MSKTLKLIITGAIIVIVILLVTLFWSGKSASSLGVRNQAELAALTESEASASTRSSESSGTNTAAALSQGANMITALQENPPPKDISTADSDIDSYLQAYRASTQPDPADFDDSYSDLE